MYNGRVEGIRRILEDMERALGNINEREKRLNNSVWSFTSIDDDLKDIFQGIADIEKILKL